jgi:CRP/FNR family cyclic AMP-dependent transcriptional regulator
VETETKKPFSVADYLKTEGEGRKIVRIKAKHAIFSQGAAADAVFYLQAGRAKMTIVSKRGKEATITLLAAGDFIGEESLTAPGATRAATALAMVACVALKIDRLQMLRALHEEQSFSAIFLNFMLLRGIRAQADLIDQLFNSSERRLARILLLMADFGQPGEPEAFIPHVTQETLAEMIGTTRSRVSFFMNRFRKLGYVEYNGHIRVNKSLLNVVLEDQLPEQNASRPKLIDAAIDKVRTTRHTKHS